MSRFGHLPFYSDAYLHHLWDIPSCPRISDQRFALGISEPTGRFDQWPSDLFFRRHYSGYLRRTDNDESDSKGISENSTNAERFQVALDVTQFAPDDLSVKTVDNYVVVSGKHLERPDEHGWVSREFTRRYLLPEDVRPDTVTSVLTRDGILIVKGPRNKPDALKANERIIPIVQMDTNTDTSPSTSSANPQSA